MPSTLTPYDLITTIAALTLAVISVIQGFWLYRKGKALKLIAYEFLSDTPVVSIKRRVGKGHIKIEYEDDGGHTEEINDASLLTLKVSNAGNTSIKIWNSDDTDIEAMEEPIKFEFDRRTVVSLTEIKTDPPEGVIPQKYLDAYLNKPLLTSDHIGLPHCILKPKESIELAVLLNGRGEEVKVTGNIFNGEIRNFFEVANERSRVETIIFLVVTFLVASGVAGLIIYFNSSLRPIDAYLITTTTFTLLLWLYVFYRIGHPFECTCGYKTFFMPFFKRHVMQKHRRTTHSFSQHF